MKKLILRLTVAAVSALLISSSALFSFAAYDFTTTTDHPVFSDKLITLEFENYSEYGKVTQGGTEESIQTDNSYANASGGKTIYLGGSLSSCEMSFTAPADGAYKLAIGTIPYSTSAPRVIEFALDSDEFTRVELPQTADKIVTYVVVERLELTAGAHTFTVRTPADYDNSSIKTAQLDALYIDFLPEAETEADTAEATEATPEETEVVTTPEAIEVTVPAEVKPEPADDESSAQTSDTALIGATGLAAAAAAVIIAVSKKRR